MNRHRLLFSLLCSLGSLLTAANPAWAQQRPVDTASLPGIVIRTERKRPPLLTAADSARERARQANARWLREQAGTKPAPQKAIPVEPLPMISGRTPTPTEMIGEKETAWRASVRQEQERQRQAAIRENKMIVLGPEKPSLPDDATEPEPEKKHRKKRKK